jgi:GNAT superfamily N-acetyltransferase
MKLEGHPGWALRPQRNAGTSHAKEHAAFTRAIVDVTFLRQEAPPPSGPTGLPAEASLARVATPSVAFYRYLYNTVGAPYLWWLRRTVPDPDLAALLASPGVSLHVLTIGAEPVGFYELDARAGHTVNLSYFGLMPHAIGRGLGTSLLRAAMLTAWAHKPRALTVNTCTADHPRALPNYLAAGFFPVRTERETWDVPDSLGLVVPERLRA